MTAPMLLAIAVLTVLSVPAVYSSVDEAELDAENRAIRLNLARLMGGKGFTREAAWEKPGCHKVGKYLIITPSHHAISYD